MGFPRCGQYNVMGEETLSAGDEVDELVSPRSYYTVRTTMIPRRDDLPFELATLSAPGHDSGQVLTRYISGIDNRDR